MIRDDAEWLDWAVKTSIADAIKILDDLAADRARADAMNSKGTHSNIIANEQARKRRRRA